MNGVPCEGRPRLDLLQKRWGHVVGPRTMTG